MASSARFVMAAFLCLAAFAVVANAHVRNWMVPQECNIAGVACTDIPGLLVPSTEANDCLAHPDRQYAGHDPPINDTETVLNGFYEGTRLMKADEAFCPGKTYSGWIKFPYPNLKGRQALLSSSKGKLNLHPTSCQAPTWNESETFDYDLQCAGKRISWGAILRDDTIGFNISFDCPTRAPVVNGAATSEPFLMRLTSSGGPGDYYKQLFWTPKLNSSCPGKCTPPKPVVYECDPVDDDCEEPPCRQDASSVDCRKDGKYSCPPKSQPSDQGYMCMQDLGPVKLHFSYEKVAPKCRPKNRCTSNKEFVEYANLLLPERESINIMLEGKQQGYLSVGFATSSLMNNSDSVYGWIDERNTPFVYVLPLGHQEPPLIYQRLTRSEYLTYVGIDFDNSTGIQTLCFGRQQEVYLKRNTTFPNGQIKNVPNVPVLNFDEIMLNWAVHDTSKSIVTHTVANRGSLVLRDLTKPPTAVIKQTGNGAFGMCVNGLLSTAVGVPVLFVLLAALLL